MKPLFKYPGGKNDEYQIIKEYFPSHINDYYEPFFGGGGIFFNLYSDKLINGKIYINDISSSLMNFYKSVRDDEFTIKLNELSDTWNFINTFSEKFTNKYGIRFINMLQHKSSEVFVNDEIIKYIKDELSNCNYDFHNFSLVNKCIYSLNDKYKRFVKKELIDSIEDVTYKSLTTCICQSFYFIIRDMYNDWNNRGNADKYTLNEMSSHWLFIREFCFGSMFRFNPSGDFNIPYGGYGYNNKCFKCKVDRISSQEIKDLFRNTTIYCGDFENIINNREYSENDFIFLDPPYDSTFTDYDNNSFGKNEHIRLCETLKKCKCKWLMDIGKTDFIYNLYKDFNIIEMDKTYKYNAKGEYDNKHTTHIIITNYNVNDVLKEKSFYKVNNVPIKKSLF